ncbi:GntR family transcriptional regulator [Micromonospora echinofusca]|uniref:GntR family transcriptional regulator n=1 Tax=Micromonospora echinofusca TaxID=47858 RepID=UPI003435A110
MPTLHYGQPRYRVIAAELRKRIENGVIPPGTLLPTEGTLTAEFRASRGTIRKAIAVLRNDGLASTAHGRGTYAHANPRFHESGQRGDLEIRQREVTADEELANLFGVEVGEILIEHESVTRRNMQVEVVVRSYRLCQSHR